MDSMTTKLIDPDSCGPRDRIDEEAQTHEKTHEKTNADLRPYVTLLAFALACILLFKINDSQLFRVESARALESMRSDIKEIKETLYARALEPVDSDANAMAYADPDVTYAAVAEADTRDLTIRYRPEDERDADIQETNADIQETNVNFGDFVGALLVTSGEWDDEVAE